MLTLRSRATGALLAAAILIAPAASASSLSPPRPLAAPTAPYPSGGHGDATVTLEVVVSRAGTIASGRVVEGSEPFAGAALAAMSTWRFEPALRDGAPVAARVRVQVAFHAPVAPPSPSVAAAPSAPPAPSAAPSASAPPSAAPASPAPPQIETVHVHMPPPPIGRTRLRAEEIRELPGAFGEPARAIESLPGVSPYASGLPFVSVRGAMPSATAYTLDGMRLPAFFHYGLGVSTFHPALIDSFDFFSGAAPAWSGRSFSLVAAESRAPAPRAHAEASVRAIDSSALVEAPFADGRGSLLVAGRYGYPGPIVSAINPDVRLQYANYQARATWSFGRAGTVTALLLGMRDVYSSPEGGESASLNSVDTWSHRLDLRYDVDFGENGHARAGITVGNDENRAYYLRVKSIQGRAHVGAGVAPGVHVRAGVDVYGSWLKLDPSLAQNPQISNAFLDVFLIGGAEANRASLGAWADATLRVAKGVELVPGVRVDSYDGTYFAGMTSDRNGLSLVQTKERLNVPFVSPRLAARATLRPGLVFVASAGMATMEPVAALPIPGNDYLSVALFAPQKATMLDMGVQASLPGVGVRAVAFQNTYSRLALFPICGTDNASFGCVLDGTARGIEMLVRRDLGNRLGGWISYTLTFANLHALGGANVSDPFERRHQLGAVASYDLGGGVRAGGRFVFYTGAPFATTTNYFGNKISSVEIDAYPDRPAPFWRLDARIEKRWMLSSTASIGVALEWLNATLNTEQQTICTVKDNGPRTCTTGPRPLLTAPSVTLSGQL